MEIFLFTIIGIGFCTALFILWGLYRKWRLANRHISVYLVASLFILNMAVNMVLTRANILTEQGNFYLRDIRRGVLVIIFVVVYLLLRSLLIDYFDTIDKAQKGWLTHGALVLALFYSWMIVGSIGQGVIEQRGHLPMDAVNTLWALGPLILILILYLIGRQFLPQK